MTRAQVVRMQGGRDSQEMKEILTLSTTHSPFIVAYHGFDIHEGDIWLFVEVMLVRDLRCRYHLGDVTRSRGTRFARASARSPRGFQTPFSATWRTRCGRYHAHAHSIF